MPALDHVFVCCQPGAPEARQLEAAGLRVGRARRHPGQGTANKCFFFADAMLELLWIDDETEARSALVQPLGLWQRWRWRDTGASPFGICLRLAPGEELPVPTWDYRPPYLPPGMAIRVVAGQPLQQPLVFATTAPWDPPTVEHRWSRARVTRCTVTQPIPVAATAALAAFATRVGAHHLELELDGGRTSQLLGCAPELPLALRW